MEKLNSPFEKVHFSNGLLLYSYSRKGPFSCRRKSDKLKKTDSVLFLFSLGIGDGNNGIRCATI